jgi:hypothetical protein
MIKANTEMSTQEQFSMLNISYHDPDISTSKAISLTGLSGRKNTSLLGLSCAGDNFEQVECIIRLFQIWARHVQSLLSAYAALDLEVSNPVNF